MTDERNTVKDKPEGNIVEVTCRDCGFTLVADASDPEANGPCPVCDPGEDDDRGVYGKYVLAKADGSEVDPDATYFILRLDTDPAARIAARAYAEHCGNEELAEDLTRCVDWLDDPPACTCGGGRDGDVVCPFHDGGLLGHPVWRHGDEAGE